MYVNFLSVFVKTYLLTLIMNNDKVKVMLSNQKI